MVGGNLRMALVPALMAGGKLLQKRSTSNSARALTD